MSDASGMPQEQRIVINALRECVKKHPDLIRLKDVAGALKAEPVKVAETLGDLQRAGIVSYNLKTGYTLDDAWAKLHESTQLTEIGSSGIGGRAVGARTMFPMSYATLSDLSQERNAKLQRSDEMRRRTRDRLRELAQEGLSLPRRPLRAIEA